MGVEPAPLTGKTMQGRQVREIEWAPRKKHLLSSSPEEPSPEEYGPWQWAAAFGRATGRFGAEDFVSQEDGKLRCPAGASLWLSEVRQENAFTQRAVYLAYQTDCQPCALREPCLASGAKGDRARRVSLSVVSCLPPRLYLLSESRSCSDRSGGWMWLVERFAAPGSSTGAGNTSRCFRLPASAEGFPSLSPTAGGAVASPLSWHDRLACNAW